MQDSVFLAMNGVIEDYEAGAHLTDLRRRNLVKIVKAIKSDERAQIVKAISKAIGGPS